jgi:hypothetical protein
MTNHPNRAKRYRVYLQHYTHSGLGWERMLPEFEPHDQLVMTRTEIAAFCEARPDVESTAVVVHRDTDDHDYADEELARCGRGQTAVVWY